MPLARSNAVRWFSWSGSNGTWPLGRSLARARDTCLDHHRTAKLFGASSDVKRVQPLHIGSSVAGNFLGRRHCIKCPAHRVNHRRAGDADFIGNIARLAGVGRGHGSDPCPRIDETDLPQRSVGQSVSVEGKTLSCSVATYTTL